MKTNIINEQHETFTRLLASVMKNIPTIPAENKTMRRVRKLYTKLTAPVVLLKKDEKKSKDKTKFSLDGKIFGKGQFARHVIQKRAQEARMSLADLKREFPDTLTGIRTTSLGLIREVKDVKHKDRFFMAHSFKTSDKKKVVVSTQFSINNIMPIFKKAKEYGFAVEKIVR